ncbi:MAG: ROK family protein [Rhodothermales bacterium]|nr:ROK family protein [Rhodothermales bacterium]
MPFPFSILGLDIGGTKTAVVEGTRDAEILQRREMPTLARTPFDERFPALRVLIDETLAEASAAGRTIDAISVSIGGPLRVGPGELIDPPHLPGWHGVPLKARLEAAYPELPVYVEHDGNAGALAEFHFGAGKDRAGLRHLIFLTFGTGLGAGFIVNGQVVHGATDTAGEVGHWRLSDTGPYGFGKEGSWEGYASGAGLVELAIRQNPLRWTSQTPIRAVVKAMLADDPEALAVAAEAGRWMGRGIALLIDALNPQLVVLGSLAVALGDRVLGPAREVVAREALPQAVAACPIVPAALGSRIGDVAAIMAGMNV